MTGLDAALVVRRAVTTHLTLTEAGVENEIGGALALGYHTDDPRATRDIDLNIALPKEQARTALAALPTDVPWNDETLAAIQADGQVRIAWPVEGTIPIPLDLFFAEHEFHRTVHARACSVPMLDAEVKIVSATDLTVFKALFSRSKDWVDIEAMVAAHDSTVDLADAARWVAEIVGEDDPRVLRLRSLG